MSSDSGNPAGGQAPQQQAIQVDDSGMEPMYMNFCRVMRTPEEVVLDFGLNTDPVNQTSGSIKINQRIVCNYYTAKRLLGALSFAVQQHERLFGQLETDINKRIKSQGITPSTTE